MALAAVSHHLCRPYVGVVHWCDSTVVVVGGDWFAQGCSAGSLVITPWKSSVWFAGNQDMHRNAGGDRHFASGFV